jgi:hypothetical protein
MRPLDLSVDRECSPFFSVGSAGRHLGASARNQPVSPRLKSVTLGGLSPFLRATSGRIRKQPAGPISRDTKTILPGLTLTNAIISDTLQQFGKENEHG